MKPGMHLVVGTFLLAMAGCHRPVVPDSIGMASMSTDRTISLQLRAEDDAGRAIGDALLVYKPGDTEYDEVLRHLGGMEPGEQKPVPPWPRTSS